MKLYLAPLEGITTYTYRNTHAEPLRTEELAAI